MVDLVPFVISSVVASTVNGMTRKPLAAGTIGAAAGFVVYLLRC